MKLMGQATPELPAEIPYFDIEIMESRDFAKDRNLPEPGNLGCVTLTMAIPGDCLNRKQGRHQAIRRSGKATRARAVWAQTYGDSWVRSPPAICSGE